MHPALSSDFAIERIRDFERVATRARLANQARRGDDTLVPTEIVIRDARPSDADAVARLATLDGRPAPVGRVVVASVSGCLRAAIGANGDTVSDPFAPTAHLVELLRMRARQLQTR